MHIYFNFFITYNTMNDLIVDEFKKLIKQIKFDIDNSYDKKDKIKNMFRLNSINKALKAIETNFKNIKIINTDQLQNIKNIGKGTIDRIDEILKKGKLSEIKKIPKDYQAYIEELEQVYGIGHKKALELYNKYNIKSVDELKKKTHTLDLSDNIITGLKYFDKIIHNIPRKTIDAINIMFQNTLKKIDKNLIGVICGSYRRQKKFSGDIDFLITSKKKSHENYLKQFVETLIKNKYIVDSLTSTDVPTKYMGLFKLDDIFRIDIRFVEYDSFYYAMLYFTGSKDFNRMMRSVAISHGYLLNEYGLFDQDNNNKIFKVNSEKDIFDILGLEYVPPEKR